MILYKVTRSDGTTFIIEASNTESAVQKAIAQNNSQSPIVMVEVTS